MTLLMQGYISVYLTERATLICYKKLCLAFIVFVDSLLLVEMGGSKKDECV